MIYDQNFIKLEKLGLSEIKEAITLKSNGYMDLIIEVIEETETTRDLSLAHYFEQNGDLMADPEIVVRIYKKMKNVEVLSYRQDSMGLEQFVYKMAGGTKMVNVGLKTQLNSFFSEWLNNLLHQGFQNGK